MDAMTKAPRDPRMYSCACGRQAYKRKNSAWVCQVCEVLDDRRAVKGEILRLKEERARKYGARWWVTLKSGVNHGYKEFRDKQPLGWEKGYNA